MRNSILSSAGTVGVALDHLALNFDRTSGGIDRAGEFHQHAIAGGLDDATAVGGDRWIEKCFPASLQLLKRAFLVATHQPAVAGDIRRQHRCQSPLHAFAGQGSLRDR